jgi:hypothetical protein
MIPQQRKREAEEAKQRAQMGGSGDIDFEEDSKKVLRQLNNLAAGRRKWTDDEFSGSSALGREVRGEVGDWVRIEEISEWLRLQL